MKRAWTVVLTVLALAAFYVRALFDAVLAETPGFDPVAIGPHSDVAKPEGVRPFVEELNQVLNGG